MIKKPNEKYYIEDKKHIVYINNTSIHRLAIIQNFYFLIIIAQKLNK